MRKDVDSLSEEDRNKGIATEDLVNAARAKSLPALMLGAVHNLKSPITAIMMNLELLSDSLADKEDKADDADTQSRYLSVIKSELERLNGLVGILYKQTLDNDSESSECDLAQLIEELGYLLRPQASSQKVAIKFHKPEIPVVMTGYKSDLKQAILNILLNALEVMPEGGVISISFSQNEEGVVLHIRDTGPGIPKGIEHKIFDLHFTTKTAATGIGLYVSRCLIEKHGGQVEVSSEEAKGACFEIRFGYKKRKTG